MKRTSLLILMIAVTTLMAVGQKKSKIVEMEFDKMEHQFGTLEYSADGSCVFKFKNNSKKPIAITNVKSSCGCTSPSWSKEPIQPGESGIIDVVYNTNIPGAFNKTIQVFSTAKNSPVRLSVKGNVKAKLKSVDGKSVQKNSNGNSVGKEQLGGPDVIKGSKNTYPLTKGATMKTKTMSREEMNARMKKKK